MTETDKLIELQALICEREAMVEENECRERQGYAHAWPGSCFNELAEAMRALKTAEAKPEQPTTGQGMQFPIGDGGPDGFLNDNG